MRAINPPVVAATIPAISGVKAAEKLCIVVTWSEGSRAGRTEKVDLAPLINSLKIYKPLRSNRALFDTVHLLDDGGDILAWGADDAIDMDSAAIERLAEDMMTSDDFKAFIDRLDFTHNTAAAQLGYSRRQIENFLAGTKPIPRVCALACFALRYRYDEQRVYGLWSCPTSTATVAWLPNLPLHFPSEVHLSLSEALTQQRTEASSQTLVPSSDMSRVFFSTFSHAAIKQITHHGQ